MLIATARITGVIFLIIAAIPWNLFDKPEEKELQAAIEQTLAHRYFHDSWGHLAVPLRRNVDLNILLFNNEIYGLTKGQYSPTSRLGTRSPSSPAGSVDQPVSAGQFALGAGARFILL